MNVNVEHVEAESPHVEAIKALWRANSNTLGFFPDGAFHECILRQTILVATVEGKFAGYLLYRSAKERIIIVHLAIISTHRGIGVARSLVDSLHRQTKHYHGIGLHCRRDYAASKMWPRLGFTAIYDRAGRSLDGHELTFWWLDHNIPNLWTFASDQSSNRMSVGIDTNIFLDIYDTENTESEEAKALLGDWLTELAEFCITTELLNDINRSTDSENRRRLRLLTTRYTELRPNPENIEGIFSKLAPLFPAQLSDSHNSDYRHIAITISSGIQLFITRDKKLLALSDVIQSNFGLRLVSPTEFILQLDELRREAEYQPVSLAATDYKTRRPHGNELQTIIECFQASKSSETQSGFQRLLNPLLHDMASSDVRVTFGPDGKPIVLVGIDLSQKGEINVVLFRTRSIQITPTLARYTLQKLLVEAMRHNASFVIVRDAEITRESADALAECGYTRYKDVWLKAIILEADSSAGLEKRLSGINSGDSFKDSYFGQIAAMLRDSTIKHNTVLVSQLESSLWPMKVLDADLPSFIIPIKPNWAQHLFDARLARQDLFGADDRVALNTESVYYRSYRPRVLLAPGRILWYVTKDKSYEGSGALRACSQIKEVAIGPPKDLYKRFKRLGVYQWQNVFDIAGQNTDNNVMAVRFCNTEELPYPVSLTKIKEIAQSRVETLQFQSPHKIPNRLFSEIYKLATTPQDKDKSQ